MRTSSTPCTGRAPLLFVTLWSSVVATPRAQEPSPPPAPAAGTSTASIEAAAPAVRIADGPALPEAIASFGAATDGEWTYVCGGHVGKKHKHSRDNLTSRFFRIRLADGRVEALPDAPPLQGLALVAHDGGLVRLGGMTAKNAAGEKSDLWSVAAVASYSTAERAWRELPPLPEPRSSFDAAMVGSTVVVAGGWRLAGKEREWLTTCWTLDLAAPANGWTAAPALPSPRRALALAALGGRVYAFGGIDPDGESLARVDSFAPGDSAWRACAPLPAAAFGPAAVTAGDRVLFGGGDEGVVYAFDGTRFEPHAKLAAARVMHRFVLAGGAAWALGGSTEDGHVTDCERLAPTARAANGAAAGGGAAHVPPVR